MTKRDLLLVASAALLTACSNDFENVANEGNKTSQDAIGFEIINRNTTRAGSTYLQDAGHYNFGVFAYKNTDGAAQQEVMKNYLVGYGDATNSKGYSFNLDNQTTLAESLWAYEKLGSNDYTYYGDEGYYKNTQTFYMSNCENQYLKYWDYASSSVDFYAYAPYINGANTATFDPATKVLTIPGLALTDGYDDASVHDFLYANKTVAKAAYNNKVQIAFKRIGAQIQIGFYENIDGYRVEILDLKEGECEGVCATPAVKDATDNYTYGVLYHKGGATVDFSGTEASLNVTGTDTEVFNNEYITFVTPTGVVSTDKTVPTMSKTHYYVIPANSTNKSGLTFHVTYKLTAEDTGETIIVRNATVYVPFETATDTYCDWKSNYIYKYIFRLTKNTTGSTDPTDTVDPTDPTPGNDTALKPIIFDGCTIENWETTSSEHDIN